MKHALLSKTRRRLTSPVNCLAAVATFAAVATASAAAAEPLDFNRDIRPLLSDRCFTCHGPDAEDRQAGLRLDDRGVAVAELDSGTVAIVPGDSAASELIDRITSDDADLVMPPPEVGKPLTAEEAALLARWIDEGAEYRGHWAFERVERPDVPQVRRAQWVKTPIDRFILARLEQEGLTPNPEADRLTLARRLSLDLLGLPPEPAMVEAFLADSSADAYERYVEKLLASPHFGERMSIEWLDAARYADSHGYQTDSSRSNWPWRDWVIRAFNSNLPFDRFTVEQLAGDMLENPAPEQIVATGFNRNHRLNGEGGIIAEEWRVETVIDRVETTGQTWLGLTVGCARCHDHKYDPLSQREFYGLFAIFNNVPESGTNQGKANRGGGNSPPLQEIPSPQQQQELVRLERVLSDAEAAVEAELAGIDALAAEWEASLAVALESGDQTWEALEPLELSSAGGASFRRSEDGSWFVEGPAAPQDTYTFESLVPAGPFGGLRLELLADASLASGGFGRGGNGNVVVTRIEAQIDPPGDAEPIPVVLTRAVASYEQSGWAAANVLEGKKGTGWAIDGHLPDNRSPKRIAVFPASSVEVPENSRLVIRIRQESQFPGHAFGRFRLAGANLEPSLLGVDGLVLPEAVVAALAVEPENRSTEQARAVADHYRKTVGGPIREAEAARDAAKKSLQAFRDTLPTAMVMQEGRRRDAFVLLRGEYDKRGEKVEAMLPAFLPQLPEGQAVNRLSLARWIASRHNPLTARVFVNRIWERLFGTGLCKTSENLGSQAAYPSHPRLLDWLAVEFMEPTEMPTVAGKPARPWDMKAFLKLLVTSSVYRQQATLSPEKLAADPENRLLARAGRIRLPAEVIRDSALAASGLLVPTIGGPSVRPWMPDGVWDETSKYGDLRGYKPSTGDGRYRRSMYTIWKRTAGPPTMLMFDAPNRETCTVKRSRSNTPLQALALLNETTFIEAAHGLAKRVIVEGGDTPAERISHAFKLALGRSPSEAELGLLLEGFASDRAGFEAAPERAAEYAGFGLVEVPEGVPAPEFAAYSLTANVILNLDEFVMRE